AAVAGGEERGRVLRGLQRAARSAREADRDVRRSLQARGRVQGGEVIMRALRVAAIAAAVAAPAFALKYAAPEHQLQVDPSIASWKPGPLEIAPEEELNLVGADVMDEITLGWVKMMRKAYPHLSVTMEARASGT